MKQLMENWRKFAAEAKNKDGKEQGADGKACWDGYKHAGTDEDGKDKCVPMEEEMEGSSAERSFQVGEFVYIIDGGLRGATGKIAEPTTLVTGEQGYVIQLYSDADKKVFGKQGDEVIAGASKIRSGGTFDGSELYDIDEEKLEEKPAKGKKSSKTYTNPDTGRKNKVSYGQKGAKIAPGTDKGDSYCARSNGIKKGLSKDKKNDPNTPNNLSRKKWKCRGDKSMKE